MYILLENYKTLLNVFVPIRQSSWQIKISFLCDLISFLQSLFVMKIWQIKSNFLSQPSSAVGIQISQSPEYQNFTIPVFQWLKIKVIWIPGQCSDYSKLSIWISRWYSWHGLNSKNSTTRHILTFWYLNPNCILLYTMLPLQLQHTLFKSANEIVPVKKRHFLCQCFPTKVLGALEFFWENTGSPEDF